MARDGHHNSDNRDAEQCDEFQEHQHVVQPSPELGGHAVEKGDKEQSHQGHRLVDPGVDGLGLCPYHGPYEIFPHDDGDDGGAARLKDQHGHPSEQKSG